MDEHANSPPKDDQDDFHDLMRRVREGSEDAAWELVQRYGGYVRRAVRRLLKSKLRSKFDSLDFVQLVWRSFFRTRDEADRFERPQHLVTCLAGMAGNKVRAETRRRLSYQQYNVEREVPLYDLTGRDGHDVFAREPEVVDVAIARERWEQLLQGQPAHYRRIIELKLQGHTAAEIGTILDLDPHTVQRFLDKLLEVTAL